MTYLRVAAVQLDFQPVARTIGGAWLLDEPFAPANPLVFTSSDESLLYSLSTRDNKHRDIYEKLMKNSRQSYTDNLKDKLKEILTFCFRQKVDVVIFPEYSLPINTFEILHSFSSKMAIIAGFGYLQYSDIEIARKYNLDVNNISHGNNVAGLLAPNVNTLVAKKHAAASEQIESGQGIRLETIELTKGKFSLGIAICLDFLRERTWLDRERPNLVVIPALTRNISEFVDEVPRDYARAFVNHAVFGGTYIGVAGLKGLGFVDRNGTVPLDAGVEGIVITDIDINRPYANEVPSSFSTPDHKLYARASLLYQGRDRDIVSRLAMIEQNDPEQRVQLGDILQISRDIRPLVERAGIRCELLRKSLDTIESIGERLSPDELRVVTRHCILSTGTLMLSEWRYRGLIGIAERLKGLLERVPEVASAAFGEYEKAARTTSKEVRDSLLEPRHRGTSLEDEVPASDTQLILYARLGAYGTSQAIASLSKQLTLLRVIADQQDPNLMLRYRLQNFRDSDDITHVIFDIICTTTGRTQAEIEALREGLGQLIGVTFVGAYSFSYTVEELEPDELLLSIRDSSYWWAEIRRVVGGGNKPDPFRGFIEWGLIINLLRRLNINVTVELECFALPASEIDTKIDEEEIRDIDGNVTTKSYKVEGLHEAVRIFQNLTMLEQDDSRRLSVRVFIGSKESIPQAVINSLGVELAGASRFEVIGRDTWNPVSLEETQRAWGLTPVETLRIFHPPFGDIFRQTGEGRYDLNLPTSVTKFPSGISLGKARVIQARSDQELEVRLSELDRLKHTYIIGKTGTGKTNLLKLMASQDVQVDGRGVTIIDPHGDLVDHVLRQIPEKRVQEVILIDLARTDALPIINPLDLDKKDIVARDRTVQELIQLMKTRVFHQYTGPRFDEIMRLILQTMLDEGYPEPASFVEVSRFLIDNDLRKAVSELLHDKELVRRWGFHDTLLRDPEAPGLLHYVTSKFDDITRDTILRCVLGGSKTTINIEEIVKKNGILLVRIPQAVIGSQAADFIGSLILLQLRMAITRKREFGKQQQYHFVYVDEFQNFANTDFHAIVAEARKFNIGFTLANQNLEQLREFRTYTGVHEQRLINAILGNVANLIVFGVGSFDAETLSHQLNLSSSEFLRIGRYQAVAKLNLEGFDTTTFTLRPPESLLLENPRIIEVIEAHMKENFWLDRDAILNEIDRRIENVFKTGQDKLNTRLEEEKKEREEKTARQRKEFEDKMAQQRKKHEEQNIVNEIDVPTKNVNVSFPYWGNSIMKVSYIFENESINVNIVPVKGLVKFSDSDVILSNGNDLPILNDTDIKRLKKRKGSEVKKYIVSFPADVKKFLRASHQISGNYLHINLIFKGDQLPIDRSSVHFNRLKEIDDERDVGIELDDLKF